MPILWRDYLIPKKGEITDLSEYVGRYNKEHTVALFVDNLIWGNITINSFAFKMKDAVNFRRSLEKNIVDFKANKNPQRTIDWIYNAIVRLRVYGAITQELRDVSTEEKIASLEKELEQKESEIMTTRSEYTNLENQLNKIKTMELEKTKGFGVR